MMEVFGVMMWVLIIGANVAALTMRDHRGG
jgi:hypothetical protein